MELFIRERLINIIAEHIHAEDNNATINFIFASSFFSDEFKDYLLNDECADEVLSNQIIYL